jgi:predicted HD phosphohydrolase
MLNERIDMIINYIFYYYEKYGNYDYIGENVSQIEHMIQGAMLAEEEQQPPEIVVAMFLHDIGHLLEYDSKSKNKMGDYGIVDHERFGKEFLEEIGIPYPIPDLVNNHVISKRYLVSKDINYYNNLSEASKKTLKLQGGIMNSEEMTEFENNPLFNKSLIVRGYDDRSKVAGLNINSLDYYKTYIRNYLKNI